VKNGRVSHFTQDGHYRVQNEMDNYYTVTLGNKPQCSCIMKKGCVHILACEISNGKTTDKYKPLKIALTQLKSNTRGNKQSGKKRRYNINDNGIVPIKKSDLVKGNEIHFNFKILTLTYIFLFSFL